MSELFFVTKRKLSLSIQLVGDDYLLFLEIKSLILVKVTSNDSNNAKLIIQLFVFTGFNSVTRSQNLIHIILIDRDQFVLIFSLTAKVPNIQIEIQCKFQM